MFSRSAAILACAFASAPLHAQSVASPSMPGMQDPQAMMAAYQAAQAAANQPGDDKLGCDELQAQLAETMNDPAIQENVAAAGAAAQDQLDAAQNAQSAAAASTAATAAGSVLPGGQWLALGTAMSQAEASKAAAAGKMQQNVALAQGAMEMMPKMMRGQRLVELATARKCEWIADMTGTPPDP